MKQNEKAKPSERLSRKLLIYFLSFSAIILGALWLMQMVFLDDLYRAIKIAGIERSADYVYEHIGDDDIVDILEEMHTQNDMRIEVYNTTSGMTFSLLYSSRAQNDLKQGYFPHQLYSYYNETKENGGKAVFFEEKSPAKNKNEDINMPKAEFKRGAELTCVRVFNIGENELMVMLRSAITPIESTVTTLRFILIIISGLFVVLSVTMSVVISRRLSKPLKETNEKAKRLAREDYKVSFDSCGYREIEELNSTLNYAAKELGVAADLQKELVANVSHDLRTPLTMIKGYAEVMRDIPGEMNEENLQAIIEESTRLSNLVSDLLDISRLQSGALPIEKKVFSLTSCTADILSRFANLSQQKGYNLCFESESEAFVYADRARIEQVLYNLISNAVNYSDERKEVKVCEKITDGVARIEITDSGRGIEPEKLKNIWDRYYRADKNHQRAVIGTGLGLSIVKEILDLHGAHFGVVSKPGEGSTFWFELPLYNEK